MYLYEERIRAVKLYIKLGKRSGPTIRQLGYPTKNSLKGWYPGASVMLAGEKLARSNPKREASRTHQKCLKHPIYLQKCF